VSKVFKAGKSGSTCALKKLNFGIKKNEIVSFVGPSGCGKTTVLRILSGLDHQTEGDVTINGQVVSLGMCGMVFQNYSSFPWLNVMDNVAFGLEIKGVDRNTRYKEAEKYINMVGLSGFEGRFPNELSGGQKQRVAIARTLAVQHEIILMDEPFGALDIKIRSEMQELLLNIWRKIKPTIIIVTHDIQEAIYLPNRIFIFSRPPSFKEDSTDDSQLNIISVNKGIEGRNQDWKNSHEFEFYEKQLKDIQFV